MNIKTLKWEIEKIVWDIQKCEIELFILIAIARGIISWEYDIYDDTYMMMMIIIRNMSIMHLNDARTHDDGQRHDMHHCSGDQTCKFQNIIHAV